MERKQDTPTRISRRAYEEKHKEERKLLNKVWGTSIPRKDAEKIDEIKNKIQGAFSNRHCQLGINPGQQTRQHQQGKCHIQPAENLLGPAHGNVKQSRFFHDNIFFSRYSSFMASMGVRVSGVIRSSASHTS